ncbi:hypothetical protein [Bacillus mycoides]|uniref:hypothetical protein n=1 Tax=Bacillus mycoides TaxID=1405 RepID=UPI001F1F8AE0|nr:hypothetical protein [Bacillus mycoides]
MAYYVGLNIFVAQNANSSNDRLAQMFIGAPNYWFAYTNEEYSADKIDCFNPDTQGVNEWIGLFFVGGNRLADGESSGCTSYVPIVQNGEITDFQANIVVTDEADHLLLAHEIGHALFARMVGNNIESTAPCCPNDPTGHSNEENDLMLPIVPAIPNPILTQEEVEKALQSPKAFYVQ